jgi:hypothetical protein
VSAWISDRRISRKLCPQPIRIHQNKRAVMHVGIEIGAIGEAEGVWGYESAYGG